MKTLNTLSVIYNEYYTLIYYIPVNNIPIEMADFWLSDTEYCINKLGPVVQSIVNKLVKRSTC